MENRKVDIKKIIFIAFIVILLYFGINNLGIVWNTISKIFGILFPFILGAAIAFILNLPMTFFENIISKIKESFSKKSKSKKNVKERKKKSKIVRIIAILFAIVVIAVILTIIFNLIVPELINIVNLLIDNIPYYTEQIMNFATKIQEDVPEISNAINNIDFSSETIKEKVMTELPKLLTSSISVVGNVFGVIADSVIAIIFAIYILIDKEKLKEQALKILYAYFTKEKADKIKNVGNIANNTFKSFFTVQCLEAMILGVLCIIGMLILRLPYAISIGILIGVTALIPVVGAFIGIVIGGILILSVSPIKVVTFVIFVLILQQIEGNVIYPRVVGTSIGLPGMWVLFAVTVGGSFGGIIGMLLGVPTASVIYTLFKKNVNKKLEEKAKASV